MRKTLLTAAIGCLFFIACENSSASIENVSFDSSVAKNASQGTNANNLAVPSAVPQNSIQTTATATPQQVTAAPTAPGMNPPHGQPGHRCDIAVGAPLNSPVAKVTTTSTPQPVTISTNPTAAIKTAPGMNPPHGQPGHRCDIAVGAPLNSPPAKAPAVTVNTKPTETVSKEVASPVDTAVKQ